jgi:hypothetical protein
LLVPRRLNDAVFIRPRKRFSYKIHEVSNIFAAESVTEKNFFLQNCQQFTESKSESSVLGSSTAASSATAASSSTAATKPAVVADKPHLPIKPSQIRDEGIIIF